MRCKSTKYNSRSSTTRSALSQATSCRLMTVKHTILRNKLLGHKLMKLMVRYEVKCLLQKLYVIISPNKPS